MGSAIDIRPVKKTELSTLRTFAQERFEEAFGAQNTREDMSIYLSKNFNLEQIENEYSNPESRFFFAEKDKEILVT